MLVQKTLIFIITIGLAIYAIPQNTIAQDTQDTHLWVYPKKITQSRSQGMLVRNLPTALYIKLLEPSAIAKGTKLKLKLFLQPNKSCQVSLTLYPYVSI